MDAVSRIAATVLYEGHVLWPYRRSAPKNRERWTFGRLAPAAHHAAGETASLQAQVLLEPEGQPRVTVRLRFLQLVTREVVRHGPDGPERVDALDVSGRRHLPWDEATEREVALAGITLAAGRRRAFTVAAGREEEPLHDADGARVGTLVRAWRTVQGEVDVSTETVEPGLARLTVRVRNTTAWTDPSDRPLACTLLASHLVLTVEQGAWLSLTDPPPRWRAAADACRNVGTWPVLVGERGERATLLAAPIVLYDYPEIAPESAGDFCDATEIDELLVLGVLGLSDAERREMAASDPRARAILERCAAMSVDDVMRLHGALRDPRP